MSYQLTVSLNGNTGLQLMMAYQCPHVICPRGITRVHTVRNRRKAGGGHRRESLCSSYSLCACELKTAPKNKVYQLKSAEKVTGTKATKAGGRGG